MLPVAPLYTTFRGMGLSSWTCKGPCISGALGTPALRRFSVTPPCNLTPSPRFAKHFVENGTNRRHLFKVFGIRFDILVDGKVRGSVRGSRRHALRSSGPVSAWGAPVVTDDRRLGGLHSAVFLMTHGWA